MLNLAVGLRLAYELGAALPWDAAPIDDPIAGISWPSLGVAGASIATLIGILGWLIRRQASGAWISAKEHTEAMDRADVQHARELASKDAEVAAWRGAHDALATTHQATTTTLADSIEANKNGDRMWELVGQFLAGTPRAGHTGVVDGMPR